MLEGGAVQKLCSPVATQYRAGRPACGGVCVGSVIGAYLSGDRMPPYPLRVSVAPTEVNGTFPLPRAAPFSLALAESQNTVRNIANAFALSNSP